MLSHVKASRSGFFLEGICNDCLKRTLNPLLLSKWSESAANGDGERSFTDFKPMHPNTLFIVLGEYQQTVGNDNFRGLIMYLSGALYPGHLLELLDVPWPVVNMKAITFPYEKEGLKGMIVDLFSILGLH